MPTFPSVYHNTHTNNKHNSIKRNSIHVYTSKEIASNQNKFVKCIAESWWNKKKPSQENREREGKNGKQVKS